MTDIHSPASIQEQDSATRRAGRRWARLCCGGAAGGFVICELAGGQWPVVLITPYLPQLTGLAVVGLTLLLLSRSVRRTRADRVFAVLAVVSILYGGLVTTGRVPWRTIPPAPKAVLKSDQIRIKVLIANVHTSNPDHQSILKLIDSEKPDIVLLPEVNDEWARDLRGLNDQFPTRAAMPDSLGNFGMAFYSRLPGNVEWFTTVALGQDPAFAVPQVDALLQVNDSTGRSHPIRCLGLHPLPPIQYGNTAARDAVIREAGKRANDWPPAIIAGDLNATRYCNVMQSLPLRKSDFGKLRDAAAPLRFSWPNTWSWWAMGIRIDHVLVTDEWRVIDVKPGSDIGSDHMPIIATLSLELPEPAATQQQLRSWQEVH
jgi:endonuclease/exonuclease/phosphatase (EEP) superfamily protein YafD